jgi:hypothetical protein
MAIIKLFLFKEMKEDQREGNEVIKRDYDT